MIEGGHLEPNYRGRRVAFPFGVLSVAGALVALIPLTLAQRLKWAEVFHAGDQPVVLYVLGVAFFGLLDDMLGGEQRAAGAGMAGRCFGCVSPRAR